MSAALSVSAAPDSSSTFPPSSSPSSPSQGILYGLGLGPGDADLMTVRAHRLLGKASHVAFFRKAGRPGQARRIVEGLLPVDAVEIAMEYPVTTEIALDDPAYNLALSSFMPTVHGA
ncbi:SAM-dependent methyltransferase [Roseateles sp. GG27B]